MLFSIVIPVYNVAEYLQKCIDSVLANDCSDCEIILVDDGCTDGVCPAICDENAAAHPELIRVIHQENKGLGGARNTGIENASGDYLFFVDSDDTIAPDALKILTEAIESSHADIYSFRMYQVTETGECTLLKTSALYDGVFTVSEHPEFLEALPAAWARIWRREFFLESGVEYPSRVWYEDIRTSTKLFAKARSIVTLEEPLYLYLARTGSIMRSGNIERNREIVEAFDDISDWFLENELYDTYRRELCTLACEHMYIAASVRVLRADRRSKLLKELRDRFESEYPDHKVSLDKEHFSKTQLLCYRLLNARAYRTLALLFKIKDSR